MFHQHDAMVLVNCEQANMVVVFALNEYVFQDDILNRIHLLLDLLPVISFVDFKISDIFIILVSNENLSKDTNFKTQCQGHIFLTIMFSIVYGVLH